MLKFAKVALAAATLAATPALAVTYDAFASFTGANGNGGFSYGYTDGTTLVAFDTNGNCALLGPSTCLHASFGNLPQASIGGNFSTVVVPDDAVLVHPGDSDSLSVYGGFIAPTAGTYSYSIDLEAVGTDATSTGVRTFTSLGGVVTLGSRSVLQNFGSAANFSNSVQLAAGQQFGFIVDRNGSYGGDSTGVNFTISNVVSNVPEPATWGLMLAGFGLVGLATRRRAVSIAA